MPRTWDSVIESRSEIAGPDRERKPMDRKVVEGEVSLRFAVVGRAGFARRAYRGVVRLEFNRQRTTPTIAVGSSKLVAYSSYFDRQPNRTRGRRRRLTRSSGLVPTCILCPFTQNKRQARQTCRRRKGNGDKQFGGGERRFGQTSSP